MKKQYKFILYFLLEVNLIYSQPFQFSSIKNCPDAGFFDCFEQDLHGFLSDGMFVLKSPFRFSSNDWLKTGAVLGITASTFLIDNKIRDILKNHHSAKMDKITNYSEYWGRGKEAFAASGLMYLGGYLLGCGEIKETGKLLAETLYITGIITVTLKFVIGRSRPHMNEGATNFEVFQFSDSRHSLPSGHTSTAFALSTVLSRKFDSFYASIALYGLAGLTAYQRIYSDKHWLSDTILGAIVGITVGNTIVDLNSDKSVSKEPGSSVKISPVYFQNGLGFSVNFTL